MDQATLVGPDLSIGREILAVLDDAEIKQITALYALFPEYSDWWLVLSSPSLDQNHSLKAGKKVHQILQGKVDYGLPTLMILPTKDPFIRSLKSTFVGKLNMKPGGTIRLGGQMFGNRLVTDAFVIRLPGALA